MKHFQIMLLSIGLIMTGCKSKDEKQTSSEPRTEIRYIEKDDYSGFDDSDLEPEEDGGLNDPYVFYIDLGANEFFETPEINTDNILDVVFVPEYNATGNIHAYTQLGVKICVNGRCDVARPSRIASPSQVFNFQDRVSQGKAKIKVSDPVYDFYCLQYRLGCPYKSMYDPRSQTDFARVRWAGRLIIGTNDTKRVEDVLYNRYDENQYMNYNQGGCNYQGGYCQYGNGGYNPYGGYGY